MLCSYPPPHHQIQKRFRSHQPQGSPIRIWRQLYISCRGFSSAKSRDCTSEWMKFTCKLCTRVRPSTGGETEKTGHWSCPELQSATIWSPTCWQDNTMPTSRLLVLHQDLQLQKPPWYFWVIPHHGQCGFKLALHAKLHTPICFRTWCGIHQSFHNLKLRLLQLCMFLLGPGR